MALNYPRLDNASGIWTMKEVEEAVKGGYWPNAGARGLFGGGSEPGVSNIIDYITIATTGDSTDFGDLTVARYSPTGCSNATRGLILGGETGSGYSNVIDYVTIASAGNATDFGDLLAGVTAATACASSTRGVVGGGQVTGTTQNVMQYVTIGSTGNATDFGQTSAF